MVPGYKTLKYNRVAQQPLTPKPQSATQMQNYI